MYSYQEIQKILAKIERATEDNDHCGAALLRVKLLPDAAKKMRDAYQTILQEIADIQELQGYLDEDDIKMRDMIDKKIQSLLVTFKVV